MLADIHEAARGRWRGILSQFGVSQRHLSGKHGPCPMCGGVDRFRFDDRGGRGTFFCNACGAGSGLDLVMRLRGVDFGEAVKLVRPLVGLAAPEQPIKAGMSREDQRRMRLDLWNASRPVTAGDPVDTYLRGRGLGLLAYPKALRFHPACRYSEGLNYPTMIAAVQDEHGQGVSLHRTFLLDGHKAPVDSPRMVTPGELPPGACVRLSAPSPRLGIAEGIETALASTALSGVPVWAALNATLLEQWVPPAEVREVVIFGDNDEGYAGQAAAYRLAARLARKRVRVEVRIPPQPGTDWADEYLSVMKQKERVA
jgi:putative DNA primase/helicase